MVVFGSLNIDKTYSMEDFVRPGQTVSALKMEQFCGGKGFNQGIALRRAGNDVHFAGAVGQDGGMLLDTLDRNGIDRSCVKVTNGATGHAIIQLDRMGVTQITIGRIVTQNNLLRLINIRQLTVAHTDADTIGRFTVSVAQQNLTALQLQGMHRAGGPAIVNFLDRPEGSTVIVGNSNMKIQICFIKLHTRFQEIGLRTKQTNNSTGLGTENIGLQILLFMLLIKSHNAQMTPAFAPVCRLEQTHAVCFAMIQAAIKRHQQRAIIQFNDITPHT